MPGHPHASDGTYRGAARHSGLKLTRQLKCKPDMQSKPEDGVMTDCGAGPRGLCSFTPGSVGSRGEECCQKQSEMLRDGRGGSSQPAGPQESLWPLWCPSELCQARWSWSPYVLPPSGTEGQGKCVTSRRGLQSPCPAPEGLFQSNIHL